MGGAAVGAGALGGLATQAAGDGAPPGPHSRAFSIELSGATEVPVGNRSPVSPDLLPVLQSVCGQVTQLRLDALTSAEKRTNGER